LGDCLVWVVVRAHSELEPALVIGCQLNGDVDYLSAIVLSDYDAICIFPASLVLTSAIVRVATNPAFSSCGFLYPSSSTEQLIIIEIGGAIEPKAPHTSPGRGLYEPPVPRDQPYAQSCQQNGGSHLVLPK